MAKAMKFPRFVHYGFRPDGTCATLGFDNKAAAWSSLLFVFAGERLGKSHVTTPDDSVAANKAGWRIGKAKVVK